MDKVLVLGMARSNTAAAAALERRGVEVVRVDREPADAAVRRDDEPGLLDGIDVLVKSPGVPGETSLVGEARSRGVPVWSEVELAWRLLPPVRLIGVTGTKGKTTTTALLGEMLGAPTAGNIGHPLSALDGEVKEGDWVVCELSSFQLEDIVELRPRVAVLLNLERDHIDRHGSVDAYRAAKLRIFENQRPPEDWAVTPRGFGMIPGRARIIEFGWEDPLPAEPRIPGAHNRGNAAAATAAARAAGVRDDRIAEVLRTFPGVPHRLELVRERGGVQWVNDSIATNTLAVRRAFASYDAPLRVILGGRGKGEDYTELATDARGRVRKAYLVGETAAELAAALAAAGVEHEIVRSLDAAVATIEGEAEPGEVALLSPAAASYDQFRDFEHRGDEFRRLVESLPG
jgi:UDP-N-acetylmuramoylalanine--D-glutamate ligase